MKRSTRNFISPARLAAFALNLSGIRPFNVIGSKVGDKVDGNIELSSDDGIAGPVPTLKDVPVFELTTESGPEMVGTDGLPEGELENLPSFPGLGKVFLIAERSAS